jgi:hypothetical protein
MNVFSCKKPIFDVNFYEVGNNKVKKSVFNQVFWVYGSLLFAIDISLFRIENKLFFVTERSNKKINQEALT